MRIEFDNIMNLLSHALFEKNLDLHPLTHFKWKRVVCYSKMEGIDLPIRYALSKSVYSETIALEEPILPEMMHTFKRGIYASFQNRVEPYTQMSSFTKRKSLYNIYNNERHSIDTSLATLSVLDILADIVVKMSEGNISIYNIIMLGLYLRQEGNSVDFVKLESYISELGIKKTANLVGSILMNSFGFTKEEVLFVNKEDENATDILYENFEKRNRELIKLRHIDYCNQNEVEEKKYQITPSYKKGLAYFSFNPFETMGKCISSATHVITDIEE